MVHCACNRLYCACNRLYSAYNRFSGWSYLKVGFMGLDE